MSHVQKSVVTGPTHAPNGVNNRAAEDLAELEENVKYTCAF